MSKKPTPEILTQLAAAGAEYRQTFGRPQSGVVIFYENQPQGWSSELRDPQSWVAGCIAVSSEGAFHIAAGGDDYNGAESWQPIITPSETPPRLGEYWHGQGGYFAGTILDEGQPWHIIASATENELNKVQWGRYGHDIEGLSRTNGQHNTKLILAAEPENQAALHATALLVEGRNDFYWPATYEMDLLKINCAHLLGKKSYWSSTQYSANHAWYQHCATGGTDVYGKDVKLALRAVRRVLAI